MPQSQSLTKQRTIYKRNFLDKVVFRLDFEVPFLTERAAPKEPVLKAIKKFFPVPEPKTSKHMQVFINPETGATHQVHQAQEHWYWSKDRSRRIQITSDAIVFEFDTYEKYEQLKGMCLPVVDSIFASYSNFQPSRLGLRYVDKIEIPGSDPTDWKGFISDSLLTIFDLADDPATISRTLSWIEFNYGESSLRLQYGMPNPDYPAPIRRKQFILDFDAFCRTILEQPDVERLLDQHHEKITSAFEEVIGPKLRKQMSKGK